MDPLQKCQFLDFLTFWFFLAQKGVFSFYNMVKHFFLAYIAWNKKIEKWPILDQHHGLIRLQKS